jgi:hypothetical protein
MSFQEAAHVTRGVAPDTTNTIIVPPAEEVKSGHIKHQPSPRTKHPHHLLQREILIHGLMIENIKAQHEIKGCIIEGQIMHRGHLNGT